MKINIYYTKEGVSFLDLIVKDFMCFLQKYIEENRKEPWNLWYNIYVYCLVMPKNWFLCMKGAAWNIQLICQTIQKMKLLNI